ncbi:MAG: carboxypeptidase-like regulatory domain-containing protein [Flavobacteriia bacterium]|nr:carboxypeptidase-like regulatory domain-containing protein [Flavobacteriia bacterium]
MTKLFYSFFFLMSIAFGTAQETSSIVGLLTDKENNNEPLAFANVLITGTTIGTTTDFDGLYEISNLTPGVYSMEFSYLGYETVVLPNVEVVASKVTTINVPMSASQGVMLEEVVITVSAKKDSETALLLEQKRATTIKTSIGAQELARKGVGNVAAAVTKTTGISRQEGSGNIFVRGLGDRYNVTTLNGLPLPSNNPSRKNIDLGLFSTDIVESISIDKTYNAQNYGDFSGANIDIISKDYKGSGFVNISVGSGVNTEANSVNTFYLNQGPNTSGFYTKSYPNYPLNNYNFTTSWDREVASEPINTSASLKAGKSFQLGDETSLNVFAVGAFENGYRYKEGVTRGSVTVSGIARRDYEYETFAYNTNATAMANIGLRHKSHYIQYNTLYVNTSAQEQQEYLGTVDAFDYAPEGGAFVQRSVFERTSLWVNQLLGKHDLNEQFSMNWGISLNTIENNIPNRRQIILTPDNWDNPNGPKSFQETLNSSDNHRYYQELDEQEYAANIATTYAFNQDQETDLFKSKLSLGYQGKIKEVSFEATQFNFRITRRDQNNNIIDQPLVSDIYNLDSYFNLENRLNGLFSVETFRGNLNNPNALDPQTYSGDQNIHTAFFNLEHELNDQTSFVLGFRGEQINQTINWSTSLDPNGDSSTLETFEWLPALSVKVRLNDLQNLKMAASKTYTLPQFKERALFQFEEVTQVYFGNPTLYASTDYNIDLKWELFPKASEIIALGVFGKYIQNPINDVTVNSATNDISYVNTGDSAKVFGAEFEIRKDLFKSEKETTDDYLKTNLSFGFNASYLYSNQELDADKVIRETTAADILALSIDFTNSSDKLSGASDLLINGDISFNKDLSSNSELMSTLAFNYFSDRIYALGTEGKGNIVDQGVGALDFIFKYSPSKNVSLGFTAQNILNPEISRVQEIQNTTVLSYKKGSNVKLTLSYNF